MANAEELLTLAPSRLSWLRVRKAQFKLHFSSRAFRRLGAQTQREGRRLRRRLLRAQAAYKAWKLGVSLGVRAGQAPKPKASVPGRGPAGAVLPAQSETPGRSLPETSVPLRSVPDLILTHLVRLVGPYRVLMMLPAEQGFTFSGICRVTCLYGRLEVCGHILDQGQPAQDVFSTYTHAYLTMKGIAYSMQGKTEKEVKTEILALLTSHMKPDNRHWATEHFIPLSSIVMVEKLKSSTVNFIRSYPGLSCVFLQNRPPAKITSEYLALKTVGIGKQKRREGICLSETALSALEELVSASCDLDVCPVILVCGSQDIGKSTFNRYLINQLLNRMSCVDYMECDVGQTEFTPPGCVSLLNITEPVLGPPFTHQRAAQKMVYYGKTSCENDCDSYIKIIKYVFKSYQRSSPLIINTMGWVVDEGLLLLIDLIRLLSPSYVVQLTSPQSTSMPSLTSEYVDHTDGLHTKSKVKRRSGAFEMPEFADSLDVPNEETDSSSLDFFPGHKLMCVHSEFSRRKKPGSIKAWKRMFQDLAVLGYLGQLVMPPASEALSPLHTLTPYQVPFSAVALRVTHSEVAPTHILYAVNSSWLGLCKILEDIKGTMRGPIILAQTPICDCLGFGICRGIDMERRLYHILTPLPPEHLRMVNCLLVGSVSIPQCIFKSQNGPEGMVPYITTDQDCEPPGASESLRKKNYRRGRKPRLQAQDLSERNLKFQCTEKLLSLNLETLPPKVLPTNVG